MTKSVTISDGKGSVTIDSDGIKSSRPKVQTSIISKQELQSQIVDQIHKVEQQVRKVSTVSEMIEDEEVGMSEREEVDTLTAQLDAAKEKLKLALLGNEAVNNLKEDLAEEKRELKFRRDVLSSLLVRYSADNRVKSIEVDQENHEIKLTGKIGKKIKEQMELPL